MPLNPLRRFFLPVTLTLALMDLYGCLTQGERPATLKPHQTLFPGVRDSVLVLMQRAATSDFVDSARTAHFLHQCARGDTLTLAFIGGSITGGALATSHSLGFVEAFAAGLRQRFPRAIFRVVNAGIGATNSRFGCSRLRDDILAHQPDLIVIDFSVNDSPSDSAGAVQAYEGLLRQALSQSDASVWTLLFPSRSLDTLTASRQHQLARHYHLPVLHVLHAFQTLLRFDALAWSRFYQDDVHPNDTGHALIAHFLLHAVDAFKGSAGHDSAISISTSLPAPLHSARLQFATGYRGNSQSLTLRRNYGWLIRSDHPLLGFESSQVGDTLIFTGVLSECTLLFHAAKTHTGQVQCQVDSNAPRLLDAYFADDWGGGYLKPLTLFRHTRPQRHRIRLIHNSGSSFLLSHLLFTP